MIHILNLIFVKGISYWIVLFELTAVVLLFLLLRSVVNSSEDLDHLKRRVGDINPRSQEPISQQLTSLAEETKSLRAAMKTLAPVPEQVAGLKSGFEAFLKEQRDEASRRNPKGHVSEVVSGVSAQLSARLDSLERKLLNKSPDPPASALRNPPAPPVILAPKADPMSVVAAASLSDGITSLRSRLASYSAKNSDPEYKISTSVLDVAEKLTKQKSIDRYYMNELGLAFTNDPIPSDEMRVVNNKVAADRAELRLATEVVRQTALYTLRTKFDFEPIAIALQQTIYNATVHQSLRGSEILASDSKLAGTIAKVLRHGYLRASTGEVVQRSEVLVYGQIKQPSEAPMPAAPLPAPAPLVASPPTGIMVNSPDIETAHSNAEEAGNSLSNGLVEQATMRLSEISDRSERFSNLPQSEWERIADQLTVLLENEGDGGVLVNQWMETIKTGCTQDPGADCTISLVRPKIGDDVDPNTSTDTDRKLPIKKVLRVGIVLNDQRKVPPKVETG